MREISIGKTNEKTECQITREDCKSDQSNNQCPRCPRSRSWGRQQEHQLPRTSVLHSSRSARKVSRAVQMFQRNLDDVPEVTRRSKRSEEHPSSRAVGSSSIVSTLYHHHQIIINPSDSVHNGSPIATCHSQCPHGGGHWLR